MNAISDKFLYQRRHHRTGFQFAQQYLETYRFYEKYLRFQKEFLIKKSLPANVMQDTLLMFSTEMLNCYCQGNVFNSLQVYCEKRNSTERELKMRGRSKVNHKNSRTFKLLEWLKFTFTPANWDSFDRLGSAKS